MKLRDYTSLPIIKLIRKIKKKIKSIDFKLFLYASIKYAYIALIFKLVFMI